MKNQPKKEKEMEIPNLLQKKPGYTPAPATITLPSKKKGKGLKGKIIALASILLFLGLVVAFYKGIYMTNEFFKGHELRFQKVIEVKIQKPVKIMTKEEIKKEQDLDKELDEVVKKALEIYYATPSATPTPKKETSVIIKPVQAKEGRVYQNYSKRTHYATIIDGLKTRFTNWEDAADLIAKEGMFDPAAINPTSGACGLGQALPCSKMQCALAPKGIDCQLDWIKDYVANRYGTVSNALEFRISNGWY